MPVNRTALDMSVVGQSARIVGYGQTTYGTYNAKREIATTVVDSLETDTVTVGDNQRRSCVGDSGGPALVMLNGVETVIGTDSYTDTTGCTQPAHYRRTDVYADFINTYAPPPAVDAGTGGGSAGTGGGSAGTGGGSAGTGGGSAGTGGGSASTGGGSAGTGGGSASTGGGSAGTGGGSAGTGGGFAGTGGGSAGTGGGSAGTGGGSAGTGGGSTAAGGGLAGDGGGDAKSGCSAPTAPSSCCVRARPAGFPPPTLASTRSGCDTKRRLASGPSILERMPGANRSNTPWL